MLPRKHRLTRKKDFYDVSAYSKKFSTSIKSKYFYISWMPVEPDQISQVGFVISKKVSKSAVKRNAIKRKFRELFRLNFDKIRPGYKIVMHAGHTSLDKNYEDLSIEFNKILQKVPFSREHGNDSLQI